MNRGKLVIALMVVIGVAMGAVTVVHHYLVSRRAIAWWGPAQATLIAAAPSVEAARIVGPDSGESASARELGGLRLVDLHRLDGLPGIDHLRRGLVDDANFVWPSDAGASDSGVKASAGDWAYAWIFTDNGRQLVVLFNADATRVGRVGSDRTLTITQPARGWQEFLSEIYPRSADEKAPPKK